MIVFKSQSKSLQDKISIRLALSKVANAVSHVTQEMMVDNTRMSDKLENISVHLLMEKLNSHIKTALPLSPY